GIVAIGPCARWGAVADFRRFRGRPSCSKSDRRHGRKSAGSAFIRTAPFQPQSSNFVLTEKYRQDPGLAASIVVISTLISILTITIVFWLILYSEWRIVKR